MRHPRIEQSIEQVGDQVHGDHDERDQEERALRERVVAGRDRLHEQSPEARPAEDGFHHHVGADVGPDRQREGGQDRQQRVTGRVIDHDAPLRETLHTSHGDELLVHDVDHRRTHEEQRQALKIEGDRQRGQRDVHEEVAREDALELAGVHGAGTVRAAGRKPAEPEREHREQDHAEPELRRRARRKRDRNRDALDPGAALPREIGARQDAERVGDQKTAKREDDRVRQDRKDDSHHRLATVERRPEFALHEVPEIDDVLFPERPMEPELLDDQSLLVGREGLADVGREWVAGHQSEHQEQDRDDGPQHEHAMKEPPPDEAHRDRPLCILRRAYSPGLRVSFTPAG